jgi:hypothetical protein
MLSPWKLIVAECGCGTLEKWSRWSVVDTESL